MTEQESEGADSESVVRSLLAAVFGIDPSVEGSFIKAGMSVVELVRVYELVREYSCADALEIGMANGTSAVVICHALSQRGKGGLTSVDPAQSSEEGYAGAGITNLKKAKLNGLHRLIEEPDYLALPKLVLEGAQFDFVLIDGWHSFDYTLLDIFYSDLLLKTGGILAIHDTTSPPVHKAVRFLETHMFYERLSPPVLVNISTLSGRVLRRLRLLLAGREVMAQARLRREKWKMLAAYRKRGGATTPERLISRF